MTPPRAPVLQAGGLPVEIPALSLSENTALVSGATTRNTPYPALTALTTSSTTKINTTV